MGLPIYGKNGMFKYFYVEIISSTGERVGKFVEEHDTLTPLVLKRLSAASDDPTSLIQVDCTQPISMTALRNGLYEASFHTPLLISTTQLQ
jgi:hypothetical protein